MESSSPPGVVRRLIDAGVIFDDPTAVWIDESVVIGPGSRIGPNTHLRGATRIGCECRIDGSAFFTDVTVGDRVYVKFSVVATETTIGDEAEIGPFAHLRPGTHLGRSVHIGNFVETKQATVGDGSKANHLTYLGDVTIGRDANIGAATITCNYDGFRKYPTTIGDRVQVGSGSTLVAPVTLGDDAYVATASTIRSDVPAGSLAFNERRERIRKGWTEKKRREMKARGS